MEEAVELAKEVAAQERPYEIKLMNTFYEDQSLGYLINLFVLEFGRE